MEMDRFVRRVKAFFQRYGLTAILAMFSPIYSGFIIYLAFTIYFAKHGIFSYDFFNNGFAVSKSVLSFFPVVSLLLISIVCWAVIPVYFISRYMDIKLGVKRSVFTKLFSIIVGIINLLAVGLYVYAVSIVEGGREYAIALPLITLIVTLNLTTPWIRVNYSTLGIKVSYVIHALFYLVLPVAMLLANNVVAALVGQGMEKFGVGGEIDVSIVEYHSGDKSAETLFAGKLLLRSPTEAIVLIKNDKNEPQVRFLQIGDRTFVQPYKSE